MAVNATHKKPSFAKESKTKSPSTRQNVEKSITRSTKREQLISLLQKHDGIAIEALGQKLGWQKHTVHAALSGLRKQGFDIQKFKPQDARCIHYSLPLISPNPLSLNVCKAADKQVSS
jgi:DNA-binding MarR family transcriptional regulator